MKAAPVGFNTDKQRNNVGFKMPGFPPAPTQTVIYPHISADWFWKNGGMAEMERAKGKAERGGRERMKDYIKKKLHLTVTG